MLLKVKQHLKKKKKVLLGLQSSPRNLTRRLQTALEGGFLRDHGSDGLLWQLVRAMLKLSCLGVFDPVPECFPRSHQHSLRVFCVSTISTETPGFSLLPIPLGLSQLLLLHSGSFFSSCSPWPLSSMPCSPVTSVFLSELF